MLYYYTSISSIFIFEFFMLFFVVDLAVYLFICSLLCFAICFENVVGHTCYPSCKLAGDSNYLSERFYLLCNL